jgi:hypothetical protein
MMAGAASGVFNTTRQVGTVIGTAGVGALLQNRLVAGFTSQVQQRASHLPAADRNKLLAGFQAAAKSGLAGGPNRHAGGLQTEIFTHGFVQAMRPTMLVPIAFIFLGAASCLFIQRRQRQAGGAETPAVTEPAAAG